MADTPTPADVAGMTNEEAATLIEWYEDKSGKWTGSLGDAHRRAIAALRSAPPAPGNGAAEMREMAYMVAWRAVPEMVDDGHGGTRPPTSADFSNQIAEEIRALPLPAPEVPEAVIAFVDMFDAECVRSDGTVGDVATGVEIGLRDWIRKEYGL